jgi:predicted GNAT superfamily acetyltransferase
VIRPLRTREDFAACMALQRLTWGESFSETVPPAILKVAQRIGGVAAGAFAPDDSLLGFVFGMTGVERGRLVHWSDMLAVRPEARDHGIGRMLKAFQRDHCRAIGVETIYWTYDPLVARNAHLNLVRLGARVVEYVPDMYGAETDSPLHRGIGSDRFVVAWDLAAGEAPPAPPPDAAAVSRVEIPCDIAAVQARSLEEAARWRASTRAAFTDALARGWRVADFERLGDACHYLLVPAP